MQVIEITKFGSPAVLKPAERPCPEPAQGEVLIRVKAAGVNRPDIVQRLGKYPPPPGITDIPGLEVAGEIVGSKDSGWVKGQKVCALLAGGGYAEYAIAPGGQCLPVPENLDMTQAAALPEAVFTVWNNLFRLGRLQPAQTVLIHGGSSGIGTTAIQMAKAAGAVIFVTAGTDEKCEACLKLGADFAVNYKTQDFVQMIGKERIDVVLDMVGGDYVPRNMEVLKTDGRHVSIAFLNGPKAEIDIPAIMRKRLILTGSTLRPRPVAEKQILRDEILEKVWPQIRTGLIKPVIDKIFPLSAAAKAHETLEGDHVGKIVLTMA